MYFTEERYLGASPAETRKNLEKLLAAVSSPLEIHRMLNGFNWDNDLPDEHEDGKGDLDLLLEHPLCDPATVLMAYWKAAPRYYSRFLAEDDIEFNREGFTRVQGLHRLLALRLHEPSKIGYDPRSHEGYDWTDTYKEDERPDSFYIIPKEFERAMPRTKSKDA